MYIPKRYGESKKETCAFCSKLGLHKNKEGLIVCMDHKDSKMPEMKCVCGSYLDLMKGKFGPYYNCINCGNINLKKAQEMQGMQKKEKVVVRKEEKDGFILDSGKYPGFDYGIE